MDNFNILDYVTVITATGEERVAECEKLFGEGVISEAQLAGTEPLVVIEPSVAFDAVTHRIKEWLADETIDAHEIDDIQYPIEYIAKQNPHVADDPDKLAQYRNQIVGNYRAQFKQIDDDVWDYLAIHPSQLPLVGRDVIRNQRKKALQLLKKILQRMITKELGATYNRFLTRSDADEAYHE